MEDIKQEDLIMQFSKNSSKILKIFRYTIPKFVLFPSTYKKLLELRDRIKLLIEE